MTRFVDGYGASPYGRWTHPHLEDSRLRYVGVGRRAIAQAIDLAFSLLWWLPFAEIDHLADGRYQFAWTAGRAVGPICLSLLYYVFLERLLGATVGKFIVGVRVSTADGYPIGWGASLTRNVLRVVDGIPFVIPYVVGAIAIWTGGTTRQRIGDRAAHTVVIRSGSRSPEPDTPPMPDLADLADDAEAPPLPHPPQREADLTSDRPWT
jgi:uncharacterized RDD family membrane protein YckC